MTRSRVFELTDAAAAALSRHEGELDAATADQRKRAKSLFIEHGENLFLAMILADERAAENRRIDSEYKQRLENERIARIVDGYRAARVTSIEGQIAFLCSTLGASITTLDGNGNVGNFAAYRLTGEAVSAIVNSGHRNYHCQLPSGIVAIRATDQDVYNRIRDNWSIPPSLSWRIGGAVYALYSGDLKRNIDCNGISFSTSCRCGKDADFIAEPSRVELDPDGRLPLLPDAVADAIAGCAVGAEKLLFSFLTK